MLVLFVRRAGGGGGALNVGDANGRLVEEGESSSLTSNVFEESLLDSCGFWPLSWLCRRVKGGVGGLLMAARDIPVDSGLSAWAGPDVRSLGGAGNGLFMSVVPPISASRFGKNDNESVAPPVCATAGSMGGMVFDSFLPYLDFGTAGFCRACTTVVDRPRRSSSASSGSSSCDVRGVSVDSAGIGSKID